MTGIVEASTVETKYLDGIIRLAFEAAEERDMENILSSETEAPPCAEELDSVFFSAMNEALRRLNKEKRIRHMRSLRSALIKAVNIAGCVALIVALTVPAALALSPELRKWASGLLVNVDEENERIEVSFGKSSSSPTPVPEGWTGSWFPAYIPDQMLLEWVSCDTPLREARYRSGDGTAVMGFCEMNEDGASLIGTENGTAERIRINGAEGWLVTGNDATLPVTMIFNYGNDCWFELDAFGLPAGEVVAVAESIRSVESEKN